MTKKPDILQKGGKQPPNAPKVRESNSEIPSSPFPDPLQEALIEGQPTCCDNGNFDEEHDCQKSQPEPQIPQVQMAFTVSLNQEGNYYTALHQVGQSYDVNVLRDATVADVASAVAAIDRDIRDQSLADRVTRTILANLPGQGADQTPKEQMNHALKKRKASVLK